MSLIKSTLLLFVFREGLYVFSPNEPFRRDLTFTLDTVKDLTVVDPQKLKDQITSFFQSFNSLDFNLLIFLSDDIVFHKSLGALNEIERREEVEKFLNIIPFKNEDLIYRVFNVVKLTYIVGINKDLFQSIRDPIQGLGVNITAILPLSPILQVEKYLRSNLTENIFKSDVIRSILGDKNLMRNISFSNVESEKDIEDVKKEISKDTKKPFNTKVLLYIFLILVSLVALIGAILYKYILH